MKDLQTQGAKNIGCHFPLFQYLLSATIIMGTLSPELFQGPGKFPSVLGRAAQ